MNAEQRNWRRQRRLGQLLGVAQRSVSIEYDDSKNGFSHRKLIPVNPKTLDDHLDMKRIEAVLPAESGAKGGCFHANRAAIFCRLSAFAFSFTGQQLRFRHESSVTRR